MKLYELEVEHHYKNRLIQRRRIGSKRKLTVLGCNRNADLRLLGEGVSPVHAYLEFNSGSWTVTDAGSGQGTWVDKKPVMSAGISGEMDVHIGGHTLKLRPRVFDHQLYTSDRLNGMTTKGSETYQQVVVQAATVVLRSELISSTESFPFSYKGQVHILPPPPQDGSVRRTQFGDYVVSQMIVHSERLRVEATDYMKALARPEMRKPMMGAVTALFVAAALLFTLPKKPENNLSEIPNNKYTQMIFDAKLVKKKQAESKEMTKTLMKSTPHISAVAARPQPSGPKPKVVSQLKLSGLSALLGKISKRANMNGPVVVGIGKVADDKNTGHSTVAAVGSLQGVASSKTETYKVDKVGTVGQGGGNERGVAGFGGLTAGAAGSGTVGILEEETEIEGGLDKEVIAKTITSYLGEVRYCYERQLSAEPDLYGKVQVKFAIDADGSVTDTRIGSSTLKNSMVEGCVLRRVARWRFPKPKGGTRVLVSYPFMFKATN